MTKVYVVGEGYYSDLGIFAVFSEERKAEAEKLDALLGMGSTIAEYELDGIEVDDPGMDCYYVELTRHGKVKRCYQQSRLNSDCERHEESCKLRTSKDDWVDGGDEGSKNFWRISGSVYAESEEHAQRHFDELRRQILAGQRPAEVDFGKN